MKAVILAGGFGTRLGEETAILPKPMIEIGHQPILWHIMKIYSAHLITDFIICTGYKGHIIKEYFANYYLRMSDVTFDLHNNQLEITQTYSEPWKVTVVDTGDLTMTGGRIKRIQKYLEDEAFCLTYGDGVANINITELVLFHQQNHKLVTLTAVRQPGRFGAFSLNEGDHSIQSFNEKIPGDGSTAWINGGFFVVEPQVLEFIEDDDTVWERQPLEELARRGELCAYRHSGFWQPMDTFRDKHVLEELWQSGSAPWKVWD